MPPLVYLAIDGHRIRNLDSVELRAEKGSDSTAVPSETPVCSDTHSPLQASSSTKKGKEADDGSGKHQEDDDYILRNLFKKSGNYLVCVSSMLRCSLLFLSLETHVQ